jgi:hypothetical protein
VLELDGSPQRKRLGRARRFACETPALLRRVDAQDADSVPATRNGDDDRVAVDDLDDGGRLVRLGLVNPQRNPAGENPAGEDDECREPRQASMMPSSSASTKNAFAYGDSAVRARTSSQSICSRSERAISSTLS